MSSFTLIPTLLFCVNDSTWRRQASSKPVIRKACWRNGHLTLSYAFSKSTLKTTPSSFFAWISWSVSWRTTTPSRMFLSGMKAVWDGCTTECAICVSLLVPALMKILKLTLRRQIGLNCSILTASVYLGSKVIVPKFRWNNWSCPENKSWNIGSKSPLIICQHFL